MALTPVFPGSAAAITYTVNPDYYADLVAGNDLTGYSFSGAAYADAVAVGYEAAALGDTGWTWVVYKDSVFDYAHTFVYNETTEEVVRFYDSSNKDYYWSHELALAAFSESGATSFFDEISTTRSTTITAAEVTEVDGSGAGWTAYHDSLVAELTGLIDKYGWQDSPVIVARVTAIQEELNEVGKTLTDSPLQSLLTDFESARSTTDDANEERYDQLIEAATGTPDPEDVMSYPALAKHMLAEYYDDIDGDYEQLLYDQLDRDEEIIDELSDTWDAIDGYFSDILAEIDRGSWTQAKAATWDKKLAMYQQLAGARIAAMQESAKNQMVLELERIRWWHDASRRMEEIYKLAPGVVERRTDMGPSLADVANLTMQVGRGQASLQQLRSFTPTTFIASGGTSAGLGEAIGAALPK